MTESIPAGDWLGDLDADGVLRGQGADAARVRSRNPRLAAVAERAARHGVALLAPRVAYRRLAVRSREPGRIVLEDGGELTGPLVARHLACATEAVVIVATIGGRLETRVSRMFGRDLPYALALDGLGSIAVETLARSARGHFRDLARRAGTRATAPVSPGMEGWPLEVGQREIFGLVDAARSGVRLSAEGMMSPRKSLSMVLGLGAVVRDDGEVCDHCAARSRCRHRNRDGAPR